MKDNGRAQDMMFDPFMKVLFLTRCIDPSGSQSTACDQIHSKRQDWLARWRTRDVGSCAQGKFNGPTTWSTRNEELESLQKVVAVLFLAFPKKNYLQLKVFQDMDTYC